MTPEKFEKDGVVYVFGSKTLSRRLWLLTRQSPGKEVIILPESSAESIWKLHQRFKATPTIEG